MRDGTEGLLVTVADIIALPAFKNVELAAPCEGAERREVRNVGILDCPPDYNEYSVYVAGELILTNLGDINAGYFCANKKEHTHPDNRTKYAPWYHLNSRKDAHSLPRNAG